MNNWKFHVSEVAAHLFLNWIKQMRQRNVNISKKYAWGLCPCRWDSCVTFHHVATVRRLREQNMRGLECFLSGLMNSVSKGFDIVTADVRRWRQSVARVRWELSVHHKEEGIVRGTPVPWRGEKFRGKNGREKCFILLLKGRGKGMIPCRHNLLAPAHSPRPCPP